MNQNQNEQPCIKCEVKMTVNVSGLCTTCTYNKNRRDEHAKIAAIKKEQKEEYKQKANETRQTMLAMNLVSSWENKIKNMETKQNSLVTIMDEQTKKKLLKYGILKPAQQVQVQPAQQIQVQPAQQVQVQPIQQAQVQPIQQAQVQPIQQAQVQPVPQQFLSPEMIQQILQLIPQRMEVPDEENFFFDENDEPSDSEDLQDTTEADIRDLFTEKKEKPKKKKSLKPSKTIAKPKAQKKKRVIADESDSDVDISTTQTNDTLSIIPFVNVSSSPMTSISDQLKQVNLNKMEIVEEYN